jgi:hypothetical protein
MHKTAEELLEEVFSIVSDLKLYKEGHMVRGVRQKMGPETKNDCADEGQQ